MAAKKPASDASVPVGFRLSKPLVDRMRAWCEAHRLKPSMTQLAETAIGEFLDREEADAAPRKPAGK